MEFQEVRNAVNENCMLGGNRMRESKPISADFLIDESPVERFREIRKRSANNPMSDDEVDDFIKTIRKEKLGNLADCN